MMSYAHQGGWDEALYVAVPIVAFAVLLRIAKRRAEIEAEEDSRNAIDEMSPEPPSPTPSSSDDTDMPTS